MKNYYSFALYVCLVSFLAAGIFWLSTRSLDDAAFQASKSIFSTLYMFIPLIVSCVFIKRKDKNISSKALAATFKLNWAWLFAWLSPILMVFLTLLSSRYIFGMALHDSMESAMFAMLGGNTQAIAQLQAQINSLPLSYFWITLISGLFAGLTLNALFAFGEEAAWRGYLFNQFQSQSFWKSSLFIGLLWGIWHAPIILMGHNYPQHPVAGVFMMILFCLALTPIANYIRLKTKSSIAVAIFHGSFNALAGIATMMVICSNDLLKGLPGLAGVIALLILTLLLFLYDRYISKEHFFTSNIKL